MENAEEIFHFLEDFSKRKPKTIPQELNEYLAYVARTGDPVYQWSLVKSLFKEKLLSVITDFYETTPGIEIPPYPNVDPFNYDILKNSLLERLDSFTSAPFTVQRICELLTFPRKQYNRIDKYMRAIEKNILVVSTREPGVQRHPEENGEANEPIVNGSDNNSEYNVDVEMEDVSWKDNNGQQAQSEPQPSSSDTHISVGDIEARLKAKEDLEMDTQEKTTTQYESVTPPELNVTNDLPDDKPSESSSQNKTDVKRTEPEEKPDNTKVTSPTEELKEDIEMKTEGPITTTLVIPEIRVDDAEMTEQKLLEQAKADKQKIEETEAKDSEASSSESETKSTLDTESPQAIDESSSDSKDEPESKLSEVLTSSEESSSSSDNTDGSSNSPKTDEGHIDIHEETNQSDSNTDSTTETKSVKVTEPAPVTIVDNSPPKIQSDNYSILDVNSELKEPPLECKKDTEHTDNNIDKPAEEPKINIDDKSENVITSVAKEIETQN